MMFKDKRIVIIAAHPDDIELGMGATLNQLKKYKPVVVVFADNTKQFPDWDLTKEMENSMKILGIKGRHYGYTIDHLERNTQEIRKIIYELKDNDIFFSPSINSTHQDHRFIGQAMDDIMIGKTVLYYEDIRGGVHQNINCWNAVSATDLAVKYKMMDCYESQKGLRHYFTVDAIATMARFRGCQINTNYAEGFEIRRLKLES